MPLLNSKSETDSLAQFLKLDPTANNSSSDCLIQSPKEDISVRTFAQVSKSRLSSKTVWMSKRMKRCLYLLLFVTIFGTVSMLYFGIYCPEAVCALGSATVKSRYIIQKSEQPPLDSLILHPASPEKIFPELHKQRSRSNPSFADVVSKDFQFDISGHDVMVFLHIQKTGGTSLGKHLVRDLDLRRGCQCHSKIQKRCTCLRPGAYSSETWLFSRYSTGWQCGLHADWTELNNCVDTTMNIIDDSNIRRQYFYITFLRDPLHRFLSEYRHVKRGATWKKARLFCGGRKATMEEVGLCFSGQIWEDPSLSEFMSCPHNLAINRQTRMLADLEVVGCYNTSVMSNAKRDELMLWSAKQNLNRMAFFGLTEEQEKSQYLFEEIFNLRFTVRFEQYNQTIADSSISNFSQETLDSVRQLNHLDVQLYEYARRLLDRRFAKLSVQDGHFADHYANMGASNFSWDALEAEI